MSRLLRLLPVLAVIAVLTLWQLYAQHRLLAVLVHWATPTVPLQTARVHRVPTVAAPPTPKPGWQDKRNIYTYYEALPDMNPQYARHMLALWLRNWHMLGYKPHILHSGDAEAHPDYGHYMEQFRRYPTVNSRAYEDACYRRWLAFAAAGAGTFMDYDVLPLGRIDFPQTYAADSLLSYLEYAPMVTHAGPAGIRRQLDHLAAFPMARVGTYDGRPHISDMAMMRDDLTVYDRLLPAPPMLHYSAAEYDRHVRSSGAQAMHREHWAGTRQLLVWLNRRRVSVLLPRGVGIAGNAHAYGLGMEPAVLEAAVDSLRQADAARLHERLPNYPNRTAAVHIGHEFPHEYDPARDLVFVVFGPRMLADYAIGTLGRLAAHCADVVPLSVFDEAGAQLLLDYNLGFVGSARLQLRHNYTADMLNDALAQNYSQKYYAKLAIVKALEAQLVG